jgi:hypothetical protein
MSRTTLILAVALLAVPAAARAQSAASARAGVDECGAPTGRRARREAGASAATRTPPRVLGVRSDSAAGASHGTAAASGAQVMTSSTSGSGSHGTPSSTSTSQGMVSASSGSGSQEVTPASSGAGSHGTPSSASASQGMTSASSGSGSQGMTSSTSGSGSQAMTPASSGTGSHGTPSSASASQGMTSSTSGSGSAVMPMEGPGTAASSSSGAGQTMASSTSAGGQAITFSPARTGAPDTLALFAGINRAALRLGSIADRVRLGPAASVSVPTALGVDAGELFFGVAYQGRTRYTEQDDGAAVIGFGIGTRRVLALETALTTYSTFRGGGPLETGGLSFKLHRALPSHTSVAVGWENAVLWGNSDDDGSLYAAASRMVSLRPDSVRGPFSSAVFTLGVGNGRFRTEADDAAGNEAVNVFGAVGVRVNDPLSLVADWTGQDLNAAASITPVRRLPLVVTVGLADITGNAGDGARFILSLGYGLAFPQPF